MSYSYTTGRNLYNRLINADSDTTLLSNGDIAINESVEIVLSAAPWTFLEKIESVSTVASQREYEIPANLRDTLDDIYVDLGSNDIYTPDEVLDISIWKNILAGNTGESDGPSFWYRRDSKILLDPIPASNGDTIYFVGRKRFGALQNADYTTGTASITSGATAVTGSGTTFTAAMVGRYIKFTSGDSLLYEIASYSSATSIAITKPYEGSTVSGSAFNIGEYAPIPFEYQVAPIYRAAAVYWTFNDDKRADKLWMMYDGGYEMGRRDTMGGMMGQMYERYGRKSEGGYMPPMADMRPRDPNNPPRRISASNFT